jgi:hypothetical protein
MLVRPLPGISEVYPRTTDLEFSLWLTTTTLVLWRKVLPEQRMVQMSTAMEIDDRLQSNSSRNILFRLGSLHLLSCGIVAVNICLVVVLVVELHDLARNGWFQRAIIVLEKRLVMDS